MEKKIATLPEKMPGRARTVSKKNTKKTKKNEKSPTDSPIITHSLRDNAEEQLAHSPQRSFDLKVQTPEKLIHELQVHQIELETQAEELRRAHLELEESRDQYLDLYDFAPLGYLTLTDKALISQGNLSAANLLGIDRSTMINARFRKWIVVEDLETWDGYFTNLLKSEKKLTTSLMLKRGDKATFTARLEGVRRTDSNGRSSIRMAISDITDIKIAERARRESEELLKTVIELLPVGVLILDEQGAILAINPEAEMIWGGIHSVGMGQSAEYKCWRLEDGTRIGAHKWAGTRAIKKGETTIEEQIEIECSGGVHKIVLNSALPLRRSDGLICGAVVVTQDITEGKAAEEQIRWLASFPELNPVPVIELNDEGVITFANIATSTTLKELGLLYDPALFIPEDKEEILRLLNEGFNSQIYREVTLGSETFGENITLDDGLKVVRIYARNITELKKAEQELKESEEFNRSLVENLPDFIVVCGPDLNILYVNPATERGLGRDASKIAGSSVLGYIPQEYHDRVTKKIAALFEGDTLSIHEIEILTGHGPVISVIVKGTQIPYHGSPAVLLLLTDITGKKVLEDALKKEAAKHLLLSNAFQAANKKLNLLSIITRHDINSQLTVMLGYLALLNEDNLRNPSHEIVQKIIKTSRRIYDLIQFTKTYEKIGIDSPICRDVRTLVETAMHGVSGTVRLENDLPPGRKIFADPLIVKVFFNLIDNAVRYGKKITTLRFYGEERGDDYVIICQDDGVGIPADQKEKIFERGYGQNTGLGLFLAREILSITGITIKETGEPGKGARFEITVSKNMGRIGETNRKVDFRDTTEKELHGKLNPAPASSAPDHD
ncbi:MAG: PAS domain-containing sensor histidine kinase [Methanoregula sp.]